MNGLDDGREFDELADLLADDDPSEQPTVLDAVLEFTPTGHEIAVADAITIAATTLQQPAEDTTALVPADAVLPAKKSLDELEAEQERIDHEVDFQMARESVKDVLKAAGSVLLSAQACAQASDDPKAIDAFTKVIEKYSGAAEALMRLHQAKQEFKATVAPPIEDEPAATDAGPATTSISANTIVFTGTARELLDMVNTKRR